MTNRGLPMDNGLISWETTTTSQTNQIFSSPKFLGIIPLSQKVQIISITQNRIIEDAGNPFPITAQVKPHLRPHRITRQFTWYQPQFQTDDVWADLGDKSISEQDAMNKVKQYYPGYLIGMPRSNIFVKAVTKRIKMWFP